VRHNTYPALAGIYASSAGHAAEAPIIFASAARRIGEPRATCAPCCGGQAGSRRAGSEAARKVTSWGGACRTDALRGEAWRQSPSVVDHVDALWTGIHTRRAGRFS